MKKKAKKSALNITEKNFHAHFFRRHETFMFIMEFRLLLFWQQQKAKKIMLKFHSVWWWWWWRCLEGEKSHECTQKEDLLFGKVDVNVGSEWGSENWAHFPSLFSLHSPSFDFNDSLNTWQSRSMLSFLCAIINVLIKCNHRQQFARMKRKKRSEILGEQQKSSRKTQFSSLSFMRWERNIHFPTRFNSFSIPLRSFRRSESSAHSPHSLLLLCHIPSENTRIPSSEISSINPQKNERIFFAVCYSSLLCFFNFF